MPLAIADNQFLYSGRDVYVGSTPVSYIYVGDTLVWRKLQNVSTSVAKYRNVHNAGWTTRTSWTVDGWGMADISVAHTWGSNGFHWTPDDRGVRIVLNGSQIGIQEESYTTSSWSSTLTVSNQLLSNGDTVAIQTYGNSAVYVEGREVTLTSVTATLRSS